MEQRDRVSAGEDDLELAECSPEASPEPNPPMPMLPPFRRPRRPPPPPPPSEAPRRSIGGSLPRRSLLAPEEFARGRDSDERKSEDEPESEKPRDRRPTRKKRRSRILSSLRPVDGPESALPSVPAIDDDSDTDDPLEAPDSGARAKEAFAAQRVRMRKKWCPDLRICMKNSHPLFGICAAHRHHPFKRVDRFLVLLVALLVAVLLCGIFTIRDCCTEVLDVPIVAVNRRLEKTEYFNEARASRLRGGRRTTAYDVGTNSEDEKCLPFYADCSVAFTVCAEGSTCRSGTDGAVAKCVPDKAPQTCVAGRCPTGWTCSEDTNSCIPASNYVCYLPATEKTAANLAADSDGTFTAIEAIFQILQIAANKHEEEEMPRQNSSSASTYHDDTTQQSPSPSTSTSKSSSSHTSQLSSSTSRSAADEVDIPSSSTSSRSASNSNSESVASETSAVKVTLTEPLNGAVYSLSSSMLIEWRLTLISGINPGLGNFRVDFSADDGAFTAIAANVSPSSSGSGENSNSSVYQFDWDLADNISWLCTMCVLRICALDVESATNESICIWSDGQAASDESSRRLQTTTINSSGSSDVTFRIVREAVECSCGMDHASFLLAAAIIGVCLPVVVILAEPLVTFYRDRKVFGLFARRDGPVRPVIAGYSATSASRKGRIVLVVVLLALCVAIGFVAAQITTTNFLTEKSEIIVLWAVTFAIAAALGVLVYCTLVCLVIFSFRWWTEGDRDRREPCGLSAFRSSLLSSDDDANNESIMSPP